MPNEQKTETQEKINPNTLELVYNETKSALEDQFNTVENLNNRASILIGFISAILGIIATMEKKLIGDYDILFILFILSMSFLIFSFTLIVIAYRLYPYRRDPNPSGLKDYLTKKEIDVKKQILSNFIDAHEKNCSILEKKALLLNISYILLFISILLISFILTGIVIFGR